MKHQVYISSYKKDAEWLRHCLFSLHKFSSGFLPPVVGVADEDFGLIRAVADVTFPRATVVARGARTWMGAQIRMMEADILCPDADVIYFLGSDCIAYQAFKPEPYCDADGRPIVLFTPYDIMKECNAGAYNWKAGVERVLGITVEHEFMRRLPTVIPRAVFGRMRAYVAAKHSQPFAEYITKGDMIDHNTSEANILGAYAYHFMRDTCCFISTAEYTPERFPSSILQMWSHGGFDRPTDAVSIMPDGRSAVGQTPRALFNQLLYS